MSVFSRIQSKGGLSQRLDRAASNAAWFFFAPNCYVRNLYRLKSYHRLILLYLKPKQRRESWRNDVSVEDNLNQFQVEVQDWNKTVYGNIFQRKRQLISELKRVQCIMELRYSQCLHNRELELRLEVEEILHHEELLWETGIPNFFIVVRWLDGKITKLPVSKLMSTKLKKHVVEFFKNLYSMDYIVHGGLSRRGHFPALSQIDKENLSLMVLDVEIRKAVFDMAPLKVLGIDGFHAKFYQSQSKVIGPTVCRMVQRVIEGYPLNRRLNKTLLVLIPKVQGPEMVSQYRLIVYIKTINDETVWMILKIDLEKAYDRLRRDFLEETLSGVGFSTTLIFVILNCVFIIFSSSLERNDD
ncbi:reverse transcriptase [Gossypium australe]|uniref:Reverse transcriptase n=1 Tax=Gossypium australe TaxID=47621 RepID=A0A5B6WV74_9ROSI|nr:reverse transcriptase [Gossypium australe]